MKRFIIGIDTGLTGGIAVLNFGKLHALHPMPMQSKTPSGHEIDAVALANLGLDISGEVLPVLNRDNDRIVIERTTAAPVFGKGGKRMGSGLASAYSMGDSMGCARMFAALLDSVRVEYVAARRWKKALNLGRDKGHSIALAHRLYPASRELITLKKHDGLAEALLLAHYAQLYL